MLDLSNGIAAFAAALPADYDAITMRSWADGSAA
jgi:hypothetical protein